MLSSLARIFFCYVRNVVYSAVRMPKVYEDYISGPPITYNYKKVLIYNTCAIHWTSIKSHLIVSN